MKWLPHRCLLESPKEGGIPTQPLHSRVAPTKGRKITSAYFTLTFLRA